MADERLSLPDAAARLGISAEAVRQRAKRGSLHGGKTAGRWYVVLPAQPDASSRPTRYATGRQPDTGGDAPEQPSRRDQLVAQLRGENVFLRTTVEQLTHQLEMAAVERAELRRMLNLEQQTVAAQAAPHQLPAASGIPLERAETHKSPPAGTKPPGTTPLVPAAVKQAAKAAGLGKQQRRKLLDRLAPLWRR